MATKTIQTRLQMRRDTAANWTSLNPVLLAGEIGFESDTRKMKFGDGTSTWTELHYAGADVNQINSLIAAAEDNFTEIIPNDGETDAAALARVIKTPSKGDIAVVKRTFATDKCSYTGYVYNGTAWGAMDGNYRADNVYLTENITLAGDYTQVGNLTKSKTGTATFATAGKTVAEAFTEIFSKRLQPTKTEPAVTLRGLPSNESLEVGSTVSKSGTMTASLSAGNYTYGPATGVTASSWVTTVKYNGASDNITTGTSSSTTYNYTFTLGESVKKVDFSATATYAAGAIAKDNLGSNSDPVVQIAAGSKSATNIVTYTPYRNFFYGVDDGTGTITSATIRALTKGGAVSAKTLSTFGAHAGAKRVIVAIPNDSSINVKKVLMPSAMNADATSSFVKQTSTVEVAGADGTNNKKAYKVWVYQPASLDSSETYSITLG